MIIFVNAKPNSKSPCVQKTDERHFNVAVKEPPIKGLANKAVAKALAEYLKLPPSLLRIKSGLASKQKVIEIKYPEED